MVSELRFETKKIRMADLGKESCVPDLLGELTMQNQLEFHLDETDEIYEGYGRCIFHLSSASFPEIQST